MYYSEVNDVGDTLPTLGMVKGAAVMLDQAGYKAHAEAIRELLKAINRIACLGCNAMFPRDRVGAADLAEHILKCGDHPTTKLLGEICEDQLTLFRDGLLPWLREVEAPTETITDVQELIDKLGKWSERTVIAIELAEAKARHLREMEGSKQ